MKKTFIQAFKLSNYHDGSYIIKNPQFHRYELVDDYQLKILEELRGGTDIATVLFPKTGIVTIHHFQNCINLIRKLQNLHLLKLYDESVLKDDPTRTTQVTIDILTISHNLAEKIIQFGGRLFSYLPIPLLFIISSISMITTVLFAPGLISNMTWSFNALGSLLILYFAVTLCLCIRQFVRAAYMYRSMRSPFLIRFCFLSIFPAISLNSSDIWMDGYKSRLHLVIIGLLSPFIVSFFGIVLSIFHIISFDLAVFFVAASSIAFFINLFPLLAEDGSELLYLLSVGKKGTRLKNRLHTDLKDVIKKTLLNTVHPSFAIVRYMFFVLLWTVLWFGFLYKTRTSIESSSDFLRGGPSELFYHLAFIASLAPVLYILYLYLTPLLRRQKRENLLKLFSKEEMDKKLATIPFFFMMSKTERSYIIEKMSRKSYEKNERIFRQGDSGFDVFVVLKGRVETSFKGEKNPKGKTTGYLGHGDIFGEISLLDNVPRTVTAKAIERTLLASIPKDIFYDYILDKIVSKDEAKRIIRLSSFLRHHPIFSHIKPDALSQLIDKLHFTTFSEKEQLLDDKESFLNTCVVVYSGELEVYSDGKVFYLLTNDLFLPSYNIDNSVDFNVVMKKSGGILNIEEEDFKNLVWNQFSNEQFLQKFD